MTTAKQVYDELVKICKEMETRQPHYDADKAERAFFTDQANAAKEIRILLSHKFPLL